MCSNNQGIGVWFGEFSQVLSPELKSLHTFKNLRQETDQKEAEDPSPLPKLHRSFRGTESARRSIAKLQLQWKSNNIGIQNPDATLRASLISIEPSFNLHPYAYTFRGLSRCPRRIPNNSQSRGGGRSGPRTTAHLFPTSPSLPRSWKSQLNSLGGEEASGGRPIVAEGIGGHRPNETQQRQVMRSGRSGGRRRRRISPVVAPKVNRVDPF
ncbi:hypothetical protein VNO77_23246 [Canavalia gladiata]|uniref:Uncharacterized protein n=1 Tax=Canavalia gladiata TaxID=3824 RepID=A0AAN9L438_CANGL